MIFSFVGSDGVLGRVDVVAAGGAVRASAGSRRWSASYAGAGYPKTLFSSHVRCLKSSAARRARVLMGVPRTGCARCREARAASSAATGCRLLFQVMARSCLCGTERVCARGRPPGMDDAGGTGPGGLQVAISQQKPASSRAIATATIPFGFLRASLSWRQRAFRRRCARHAMLMISGGWSVLAALERFADTGIAAVVVGRFDQQPPRVRRAGLRDRPLAALAAGGVLGGHDPEIRR